MQEYKPHRRDQSSQMTVARSIFFREVHIESELESKRLDIRRAELDVEIKRIELQSKRLDIAKLEIESKRK